MSEIENFVIKNSKNELVFKIYPIYRDNEFHGYWLQRPDGEASEFSGDAVSHALLDFFYANF